MAKKRKYQTYQALISPDIKIKFKALMNPKQTPRKMMFGFPTKNINQLWKWDTLEDVTI